MSRLRTHRILPLSLALAMFLVCTAGTAAQQPPADLEVAKPPPRNSTAPSDHSSAQAPTDEPPDRIVERRWTPGAGRRLVRIPIAPFIVMGKGMEKGLIWLEENRFQLRLKGARQRLRENHIEILTGGLGPGTGFAFGVKLFDENVLWRGVDFEMPLRYSMHNYQQAEVLLRFPLAPKRRVFLEFGPWYRSRPQEDFFGLGITSDEDERTNYHLQERGAGASLGAKLPWNGRVDFHARYQNGNILRGKDTRFPSTERVFPGLAGLARGASLLRYGWALELAPLDKLKDPHRGFRGRLHFDRVDSRNSDDFNFHDYGFSAEGYVPLGRPRTLALRFLGEFRQPRDGGRVPFFALPYLGGQQTMRGFREFRFYDNNALLLNAEYRYLIWKYIDVVFFVDHGQVARRARDLDWDRFRVSYGGGFRVKTRRGVAFRFDIGHSNEGTRFYFTFSPEF